MKTQVMLAAAAALAIGGVSACQKKSDINTSYSTVTSKADLVGRQDFAIPRNAGSTMADKRLVLFMAVNTSKSGSLDLSPGALQALNNFIEAQIPQIKRFRVFGFYNTGADDAAAVAADAGLTQRRRQQAAPPDADVTLNISLDVQSSLAQFGGRVDPSDGKRKDTVATYRIVASCNLLSETKEVLTSRNITAMQQRDVVERVLPNGERRFAGGFDPNNSDNVNSVLQICARQILSDLTLLLGEYYPITGDITTVRGGRMTMNKGVEEGMTNETQVLIWADDGGIPTGIAYANCEAMADRTVLNIYGWNTRDPDAAKIVREVQNNPDVLKTMRLRATSVGLPVPMQWQEGRAE